MRLRALVKDELASGMTPELALESLEELRQQDPDYEDIVLDVMDFITGWSSPHVFAALGLATGVRSRAEPVNRADTRCYSV